MSSILNREQREAVVVLRSKRPEKRNDFNRELALALAGACEELQQDDQVRVVVLTGVGEAFSAGADMTEALASFEGGRDGQGMAPAVVGVAGFTKPIIAAVNGYAFGGGALIACSCDIRIASERAAFRFPGANYGLVVSGSQLPRIVGAAMAKELIFTARLVEAEEAGRSRLVHRVVRPRGLDETGGGAARRALAGRRFRS